VVVGDDLGAKPGKQSYSGSTYVTPSTVEGSVCVTTGTFSGGEDGETSMGNDVLLLSGVGTTAAKFKAYKVYGTAAPGTIIAGDLATKGGAIAGTDGVVVGGTTTTDGTHPGLTPCEQARTDLQTASNTLKALSPTQTDLGNVVVQPEEEFTISAGAGVNVINATNIILKKKNYYGSPLPSSLHINFAPDTVSVIVNVSEKLTVSDSCVLDVFGGDPFAVILNVHGEKAKVKLGKGAEITPAILAPAAKLKAPLNATVSNLFGAKVSVRGGYVTDALLCGP
jgi:choice-of-anchor A domain-containing protein